MIKKHNSLRTPASGKFTLKLEYDNYFKLEVSKMGLVTKKFEFDTEIPSNISENQNFSFEFIVVLFPNYNYIDMSVLDQPLAVVRYTKRYDDFFYDYDYAKKMHGTGCLYSE